jgi:hypothetical protein
MATKKGCAADIADTCLVHHGSAACHSVLFVRELLMAKNIAVFIQSCVCLICPYVTFLFARIIKCAMRTLF